MKLMILMMIAETLLNYINNPFNYDALNCYNVFYEFKTLSLFQMSEPGNIHLFMYILNCACAIFTSWISA